MSRQGLMLFLNYSRSTGPMEAVNLMAVLCEFVNFRTMGNDRGSIRDELVDLAKRIWPDLTVHIGDTHLHFRLNGQQESFYVDWL